LSSFYQSQSRPDTTEAAASPRPLTRGNSINFSAARSRQKNQAAAKAALTRGAELLSMIRLDIVSFDHLDMQPIRWEVFLISQSRGGLLYFTLTANYVEAFYTGAFLYVPYSVFLISNKFRSGGARHLTALHGGVV
jgi:hypothetical protein